MSKARSRNGGAFEEDERPTASELLEQLDQSDGSAEQFLVDILAVHCFLCRARAGAVLRPGPDGGVDVLAVHPNIREERATATWLKQSARFVREVASKKAAMTKPLRQQDGHRGRSDDKHVLLVPLETADVGEVVEAFVITGRGGEALKARRHRLELTTKLLSVSEKRLAIHKRKGDLRRLRRALEVLSATNMQNRFGSTAMALCNEVAAQWKCERVSVGFLKGRYVRVKAVSHTEDFRRKMKVVQDIESAMEECLDQDCEVLHPASADAMYIGRAAAELSRKHGPLAILSLPLREDGEVRGVLTVERLADQPFSLEEIEAVRLVCNLCTARLLNLHRHDRWIGAKVVAKIRDAIGFIVGVKHTWTKILAIVIFAIALFLIFAKGQFRVEAPFVFEAVHQQVVCAPFDGYIKSVNVEVGDTVEENTAVLAELDTSELRLRLAAAKAEKQGYLKQAAAAMRDGEIAQAQIAQASSEKVDAQINLLTYQIHQAQITSSTSGTVVKGDLKRQIGAPVKTGDVLFEVTPLESLRAELLVSEEQVFDIAVEKEGYLATVSYPAQRIKFVVERVNPMAEVINNRNVFKVRVRLLDARQWMRPGMEGVAKVSIGERRYVWIWTRKIVNWLRMKLWL